ncbi:MAG: hypothetical protein ABI200_01730, partial [Gaiellales bacterium]
MSDDLIRHLRANADELGPTDGEREQLREQLREMIAAPEANTSSNVAPAEDIRGRRRARRPRIAFGSAITGAAVIAIAVALWPNDVSRGPGNVQVPTTAFAALQQAADAAGQAEWTPLGSDEFHHLAATSFRPDVNALGIDPD